MKIAFRADASIQIGTGHVMRCLTLAEELKSQGHECLFICREHKGHLGELIAAKGFVLHLLPMADDKEPKAAKLNWNNHASWLGVTWQQDADETSDLLSKQPVDWLVVDHYALDIHWEQQLAKYAERIMVIDDLADRDHACAILLDQTYGRDAADYRPLVPEHCELLCGSQYALLRPEFAALRPYSLQRRRQPILRQLLINMGGVDKDNVTGKVLEALQDSELPADCNIVVVMGATAPWLEEVKQQAETLPWPTEVKVGVNNMAQLMADSDLAIGAAGATSWERCCLGLPTAMMVLAENQRYAASLLKKAAAVRVLLLGATLSTQINDFVHQFIVARESLKKLVNSTSKITDGRGCKLITGWLTRKNEVMNMLPSTFGQLRSIEPHELEMILCWRNAPEVRANMYTHHEITLSEHLAWWERIQGYSDQQYFMYELQGVPLGVVYFTGIDQSNKNSSWGFYASPEAPRGTGSKMEFLALEYAFRNLKLRKLCCEVLAFNSSVIKLHKKFGFKVEGILREQHMLDESFIDVYRLGILASEWDEQCKLIHQKLLRISENLGRDDES